MRYGNSSEREQRAGALGRGGGAWLAARALLSNRDCGGKSWALRDSRLLQQQMRMSAAQAFPNAGEISDPVGRVESAWRKFGKTPGKLAQLRQRCVALRRVAQHHSL